MSELPDYLPGNPPMYGVKQEEPSHYQGESLKIAVSLSLNGVSVSYEDYNLNAVVKDDLHNPTRNWTGSPSCGITVEDSVVYVVLRQSDARAFPSGRYYLSVVGQNKRTGEASVLFEGTFNITPSASSPYPIIMAAPTVTVPSVAIPGIIVPIGYF